MNKENEGHIASTNNSKAVFDLPSEDVIQHQQQDPSCNLNMDAEMTCMDPMEDQ